MPKDKKPLASEADSTVKETEVNMITLPVKVTSDEKKMKKLRARRLMIKTIFNSLALFVLGVMLSMKGPSFIDLQIITGTDVERGSAFFTAYAFGYMLGSLIAGAMYNRVQSKSLLMLIPLVLAGVTCGVTPWCENFILMVAMQLVNACFSAIFETTANTEEVRHWDGKSDSAMQFLSFTYSLGGIVGPLILEPFLAPKDNVSLRPDSPVSSSHNHNDVNHVTPSQINTSVDFIENIHQSTPSMSYSPLVDPWAGDAQPHPVAVGLASSLQLNASSRSSSSKDLNTDTIAQNGYKSRIHLPYVIAGVLCILVALPFFIIYLRSKRKTAITKMANSKHPDIKPVPQNVDTQQRQELPLRVYVMLLGLLSLFYFFYTTVDDPFSLYLSVFVVSHLSWSKEQGALISSIYWGCSTVTKLTMVILIRHVDTSKVLLVSTIGMTLSTLLLIVCSSLHAHQLVWVATALLALSQSSVFGGGFAWADSHLLKVDGKVTSCTIFFAALGGMIDPLLLGKAMKEISPMAFPYLLCGQSFITFLLFLSMLTLAKPYVLKRFGPPRTSLTLHYEENGMAEAAQAKVTKEDQEGESKKCSLESVERYLGVTKVESVRLMSDKD
ncbi:sodium-dependent glucose transporter 1 [Plakobranchus ocellatus]|uniref:Sodium-dependent glucose transporter 1 n=1 Tax=Plakobranchus ocellatus TaxID=259542 RepID=A0AAV3Z5S0_9GAST|nr:sodium-dependent glucose transporter 1 [Plakobranchus ocellatus]